MKVRAQQLDLSLARNDNDAPIRAWFDEDEPWADNFAGGGGVSEALKQIASEMKLERKRGADVAINHWDAALAMHEANHPTCAHHCEDVARFVKFDMLAAARGRRYALAWFSPTCIFFSQAKGGALDEEATKVRGLAWIACSWAASPSKPRVLVLENVKPFLQWGPLHRQHSQGCSKEIAHANGKTLKNGKHKAKCRKGCNFMRPIKSRKGELFNAFVRRLRTYYAHVEWRVMRAHDYGAPTSRERAILIASENPVSWPTPSHGPGLVPYRTAAECIDWSIPCPSIFERKKDLADATLERVRFGFKKFVLDDARPFVVHVTHGARAHDIDEPAKTVTGANRGELGVVSPIVMKAKSYGGGGNDAKPAAVPLTTVTGSKRGEHAIAAPIVVRYNGQRPGEVRGQRPDEPVSTIDTSNRFGLMTPHLVHVSNGERVGQAPRVYDPKEPLRTVVATGENFGIATPFFVKNYSERDGGFAGGAKIDRAIGAITGQDHHSLALPQLVKLRGTSDAHVAASASSIDKPLDAVSAGGTHHALMMAYVVRYNGTSEGQRVSDPLSTIDTTDRFALVELTLERDVSAKALRVAEFLGFDAPIVLEIDGEQWVLVDIGFRMLVPRELFLCQGFPPGYKIAPIFRGKPLTKTAQIKCVGNSVPPPLAKAVALAALRSIRYTPEIRRAA